MLKISFNMSNDWNWLLPRLSDAIQTDYKDLQTVTSEISHKLDFFKVVLNMQQK